MQQIYKDEKIQNVTLFHHHETNISIVYYNLFTIPTPNISVNINLTTTSHNDPRVISHMYIYTGCLGINFTYYYLVIFMLVGGIDANCTSFESLDPSSFIYVMTERMDDWNPPESWKIITCIMMIHASCQNWENTVAAQHSSLNTINTIRCELENCDGNYEAVARRKQHNRRSDCVHTAEFPKNLQKNVMKDPGIRIMAFSSELNITASTMKLALNEDLRYYSFMNHRGHPLTEKACENRLTKGKKLLSKMKHPAEPQTIWFFSDEKNVFQDQKYSMQNNRWLAYSPKDTPRVMQTKFSQTVMVFGCVSCEGDASVFFQRGSQVELRCQCGAANHSS